MNPARHKNWLLTIFQLRAPMVALMVGAVLAIMTVAVFLFRPVYSATTIVALDSELARVLGVLSSTAAPATSQGDFIRYEYFSTHSLQLMKMPHISQSVLKKLGLKGWFGKDLYAENFAQPSFPTLMLSNAGQGVGLQWITDTQTFSITGYSGDPDQAVIISREYADAFLNENSGQFRDASLKILERTRMLREELGTKIADVDVEIRQIREKYKSVDPTTEATALTQKVLSTRNLIETEQAKEARYQQQVEHLKQQAHSYEQLKRMEQAYASNPVLDTIKTEMRTLAQSLAAASADYTPDHPDYKAIEKKLSLANENLKKEAAKRFSQETVKENPMVDTTLALLLNLTVDHASYEVLVEYYNTLLAYYENRVTELSAGSTLMANATSRKEALVATLQSVIKDQYRIESVINKTVPFFRVVSHPYVNKDNLGEFRYFPKRKRIILFSGLISALFLTFLVIGKELKENRLYYGWQFDGSNARTGYADVPRISDDGPPDNREALICSHIQDLCSSERAAPVIRISSKLPGEGKATIARALAWYFKRIGETAVLVDGDILNRSLSRMYGVANRPGLLDILSGAKQLEETVIELSPGIFMLPGGGSDEIGLSAARFRETIAGLIAAYGRVIYIDPPFTADHAMLSENLPPHDVVMVAQSGRHSVFDLEEISAMRKFHGDANLKWIIINKTPEPVDLLSIRGILKFIAHPIRSSKIAT